MDFGTHPNSVTGYEKRDHITHFLTFHFKTLLKHLLGICMRIFASCQCADYARAHHMRVQVRRAWHVLRLQLAIFFFFQECNFF